MISNERHMTIRGRGAVLLISIQTSLKMTSTFTSRAPKMLPKMMMT